MWAAGHCPPHRGCGLAVPACDLPASPSCVPVLGTRKPGATEWTTGLWAHSAYAWMCENMIARLGGCRQLGLLTCGPAPLMEPTPTLDSGGWLSYLQISLFRQPMGGQSYMRLKRAIAVLTATAVSVIGLSLVAASPAAAGTWRAYGNTNPITSSSSTWRCAATKTISTNVLAQVCAIRSEEGSGVQGAVIVRNNRSSLYSVDASMDLKNSSGVVLGGWACPSSGVGANSWSVCFGSTLIQHNSVNSLGWAKGEYLGISPNV